MKLKEYKQITGKRVGWLEGCQLHKEVVGKFYFTWKPVVRRTYTSTNRVGDVISRLGGDTVFNLTINTNTVDFRAAQTARAYKSYVA